MWSHVVRGLGVRLRNPLWRSRWSHRIKRQVEAEAQLFFRRLRGAVHRHAGKGFAISATGVYNVNSNNNFHLNDCKIEEAVLEKLSGEMSEMEALKAATIVCASCKKRLIINKAVKGKEYCGCPDNKATADEATRWQPFLEEEDIIIWRREEKPGDGLYSYKVYGRYKEISAEDFLSMNLDADYWSSWDETAASLQVLETVRERYGGHCVVHWEMEWPKFFSNRDYVYVRKYAFMDGGTGKKIGHNSHPGRNPLTNKCEFSDRRRLIVIASRSCEHPDAPQNPSVIRVTQYWSNMVIKPFSDSDKPGMEFSLTYFDDPGTNMPSALQSWVAGYGMPDYLDKMRKAAGLYKVTKGSNITELPAANTHADNKKSSYIPEVTLTKDSLVMLTDNVSNTDVTEHENSPVDSTTQFLNLISGDKAEISKETVDEAIVAESYQQLSAKPAVLDDSGDQATSAKTDEPSPDGQDKSQNQNQLNRYNYWHLWPLYYFA